jgi:hypothetical protein
MMRDDTEFLTKRIRGLLAGQGPDIQGAILADLLAYYIVGWAPQLREEVLAHHIETVRQLAELNDKELFGDAGHPGGRH